MLTVDLALGEKQGCSSLSTEEIFLIISAQIRLLEARKRQGIVTMDADLRRLAEFAIRCLDDVAMDDFNSTPQGA